MKNQLLQAALWYARQGWPIFPCAPNEKRPLTENGYKGASTDEAAIRGWWQKWPNANIALATGAARRLVVDCDAKNGQRGLDSWRELRAEMGIDDRTPTVETPSKGLHVHYSAAGQNIRCSAGKLGPGLDVRAEGGYALLPPSRTRDGEYAWAMGMRPTDMPLLPLPAPLAARLAALDRSNGQRGAPPIEGEIRAGTRNSTLFSLAGSMRRRGMTPEAIEAALQEENRRRCDPPLPPEEVAALARNIGGYAPAEDADGLLTDLGNCLRFVEQHRENVRYNRGLGWLVWDGQRWAKDEDGAISRLAKETVLRLYDEAKAELQRAIDSLGVAQVAAAGGGSAAKDAAAALKAAEKAAKERLAWAEQSQSRPRLEAMVSETLAGSETALLVRLADLDKDPLLLNCANGALDLTSGELRPHRREDLITKNTNVVYDPDARSPLWEQFLSETTGGDAELLAYLQRWAGYALTGDTREEQFAFLLGKKNTGKTTFIEALRAAMGEYAKTIGFDALLVRTFADPDAPRPDLASLPGVRLVTASEAPENATLDSRVLNSFVGRDEITVRTLFGKPFSFRPAAKFVLAANKAPRIPDDENNGIWRRIKRLPFERPAPKPDPSLKTTLTDPAISGPAVLAWAVQGCLAWQRKGLGSCPIVEQRTRELQAYFDPLASFIEDCCVLDPLAEVPAKALRAAYEQWCTDNGAGKPISNREWGDRLEAKGCTKQQGRRGGVKVKLWAGIGLVTDSEPPSGTDGTDAHGSFPYIEPFFKNEKLPCASVSSVSPPPLKERPTLATWRTCWPWMVRS